MFDTTWHLSGNTFSTRYEFLNESDSCYLVIHAHYPPGANDAGYEGVVRVVVIGGTKSMNGSVLNISGATSVVMLTRTKKYYHDCENQWNKKKLQNQLAKISPDYQKLLKGQIATHGAIYNRVRIDLNASEADRILSNEELLEKQKKSDQPVKALWERIFNAGRYYFLSSSSDQTPPDLLGIWTGDCNVGWGGFCHLDASLNLHVSGGNIGDMPEAMEGYFKLIEDWKKDFRTNAWKLFRCRGMLACGNSPGPTSGLMAFWEHYLITGDIKFLKDRLYPMLKEMGYFYEDFLTLKDKNGNYIFAGSVSPEKNKILFKAALKTLEKKDAYNYENAGHGLLHASLIAARLKNSRSLGNKLMHLFKEDFYFNSMSSSHYNNHGVFYTDVCNTVPTIMMEMLIASSPGQLEFLPALPEGLDKGAISGVKGRNRVTIESLSWNLNSNSLSCTFNSDIDQRITLIERDGINNINTIAKVAPSPLGQIARRIYLKAGEHTKISIELGNLRKT